MRVIPLKSLQLKPQLLGPTNANGDLGVANIKLIITVLVTFLTDLVTVIRDRDYLLLFRIIPALIAQGNIIAQAGLAWLEIKDTSLEESNDIHLHFTQVLDLKDDETEKLIEDAFGLVPEVYLLATNALTVVSDAKALFDKARSIFGMKAADLKVASKANVGQLISQSTSIAA